VEGTANVQLDLVPKVFDRQISGQIRRIGILDFSRHPQDPAPLVDFLRREFRDDGIDGARSPSGGPWLGPPCGADENDAYQNLQEHGAGAEPGHDQDGLRQGEQLAPEGL
jgi:hypothetical protein